MQLNGFDRNLQYLLLTVLIIAAVAAYYNLTLTEDDAMSFGMCDMTLECQGVQSGDYCIGIEHRSVQCVNPETAEEWRRAEAECGLDAQGICNENPELTGTDWADDPRAEWDGTSCREWAEQDENVDLLTCEDTFNDITQWSGE